MRLHQYSGQALQQTCSTLGSRDNIGILCRDQWLLLTFSRHKSNSLKLRSFPLSQNDKDFSAPLFLLSALLALYSLWIVQFFSEDFQFNLTFILQERELTWNIDICSFRKSEIQFWEMLSIAVLLELPLCNPIVSNIQVKLYT